MSTWSNIPDDVLEPGKPIRSVDAIALRDNPIAIALGAAGAPRVTDAGLSTTATNTGRDWVLNRTALAAVGTVGTYAFLRPTVTTDFGAGATLAGSSLRYSGGLTSIHSAAGASTIMQDGATPTGTWRCMGHRQARDPDSDGNLLVSSTRGATLWLRIS